MSTTRPVPAQSEKALSGMSASVVSMLRSNAFVFFSSKPGSGFA